MDVWLLQEKNKTDDPLFQDIDQLEALDRRWQLFLIVLYSLTSLLAFCENIVVVVVQFFGKRFEPVIRKCLINLAISDVLLGVLSVPFTYTDFMLGRWIFPQFLCPLSQFVLLVSVFVSAFTLTLISIERYFSIVNPLSYTQKRSVIQKRCWLILSTGWILGCFLSLFSLLKTTTVPFEYEGQQLTDCRFAVESRTLEKAYVITLSVFNFLIPIGLQIILYVAIGNSLKTPSMTASQIDRIKIVKMLILLVVLFAGCWLPIKCFLLITMLWPQQFQELNHPVYYYIYVASYFVCHWLSMANSCANPIVYCFMSKSFRDDFWDLFKGKPNNNHDLTTQTRRDQTTTTI